MRGGDRGPTEAYAAYAAGKGRGSQRSRWAVFIGRETRDEMSEPIRITRATVKKQKPKDSELSFGTVFTDHMFVMDFQEEKGWYDPRIEPYGPFPMDPAAAVLHYARPSSTGLRRFARATGRSVFSGRRSPS